MHRLLLAIASAWLAFTCQSRAAEDPRRAVLAELLEFLPKSTPWEDWLQKSGELPPDFSQLPANPFLPDPLGTRAGGEVKSKSDWPSRRKELLQLFQRYVTGSMPPAPGNVRVAQERTRQEAGVHISELLLEFGPAHRARLNIELMVPQGKGPFPVFVTQENHRRWATVAVSRGYMACVYAGADSRDDTGAWVEIWQEHDWTKLARRAWAASRCIDYLYTRGDVDRSRIALTGHSRNGKTSIIAAAFDDRINAVISSSSGAGGACSFRYFSERHAAEGIELITRSFPDWLHPRLRFFAGREERLPIDMPQLVACVAPRPFLFATALNDSVESAWAIEQSRANAARAYALLGATNNLDLLYREGSHATGAHEIERYVDWLDWKFGRSKEPVRSEPVFPTYGDWLRLSGERVDPAKYLPVSSETPRFNKLITLKAVQWAMGEPPPIPTSPTGTYGTEPPHQAAMLGRSAAPGGLARRPVNFGHYITGDLYFPTNLTTRGEKLRTLIWLHPISVPTGYSPGYRRGEPPHLALARAGHAVFAFDQIGNGARVEEVKRFYERHPHWSLLGRTVSDVRAAVDALQTFEMVATNDIWIVGFEAGASAGLHAAALDPRIAGVVAVGGFGSMRPMLANRGQPTFVASQHLLPILPRLGAFKGHEDRLPYDYRELVDAIAPRPVHLVAASIDQQVDAGDLRRAYLLQQNAMFHVLRDYSRFSPEVQKVVIDVLKSR